MTRVRPHERYSRVFLEDHIDITEERRASTNSQPIIDKSDTTTRAYGQFVYHKIKSTKRRDVVMITLHDACARVHALHITITQVSARAYYSETNANQACL